MRYHSPDVAANKTADGHRHRVTPVHITFVNEHQDRRSSHAKSEEVLQCDHMSNISARDETQRPDHEDANPGAEVAAIQSHQKNARNRDRPQRDGNVRMDAASFVVPNQDWPQHNDDSGD